MKMRKEYLLFGILLSLSLISALSDEQLLQGCIVQGDEQLLFCPLGEIQFNVPIGLYSAGGGPGGTGAPGGSGCGSLSPSARDACCQSLTFEGFNSTINRIFFNETSGECEMISVIPIEKPKKVDWILIFGIFLMIFVIFILLWKRRKYRVLSKGLYYYFYKLEKAKEKREEIGGRLEKRKNGEWVEIE